MNAAYFFSNIGRFLAVLLKDLVWLPVWWYSQGLFIFARGLMNWLKGWFKSLGIWVWLKNIFVPMYGQNDIWGKLISFFMRVFQIIVRTIFFVALCIFAGFLLLVWMVAPLYAAYQIYLNFINFF